MGWIASIIYDIHDIATHGLNWGNGLSLAADVVSLALPVVTGGGAMVHAAMHADDAVHVATHLDDAVRVAEHIDEATEALAHADEAVEALSHADEAVEGLHAAEETRYYSFTRRNFRRNLSLLTGVSQEEAKALELEAHCVLPCRFEREFNRVGINIHDPHFGSWVERGPHRRWSRAYNREWERFFRKFETMERLPTIGEVFRKAETLAEKYEFRWFAPR